MKDGNWLIRDFRDDDYEGLVSVLNQVYPDHPSTVEEARTKDNSIAPRCRHRRWVAAAGGEVVALGHYNQLAFDYHPQKFYLNVCVRQDFRGRGIGTRLFGIVVDDLRQYDPRVLRAHVREDRPVGLRFLTERGFVESRRESDSRLVVSECDLSEYDGLEAILQRGGVEIKTLRELESDPERDRKLYDLDWIVTRDEPGSEDDTRVDFETFVREGINARHRLPDGYFVAVADGDYVGLCLLNAVAAGGSARHGITGVTRAYRRRGVATALKVRAIRYARENGVPHIQTVNEAGNQAMLAINRKLGFRPLPAWIGMEKQIVES